MDKRIIIPKSYKLTLSLIETEVALKMIKDTFEAELAKRLNLIRVSAPLFVKPESGLNDDLDGTQRAVIFNVSDIEQDVVIVHSLAKWKRMALDKYGFEVNKGLYTDMNAIRRDEELDNLHSIYVDQWDWEKVITKEDRSEEKLVTVVKDIFTVFKKTEAKVLATYPQLTRLLPESITFVTAQWLEDKYPKLTPKQREDKAAKEYKAVFIMKIGGKMKSGKIHDGRAPDYDDWELNGDIIFWYPILNCSMELSSMGIRVDEATLTRQLKYAGADDRRKKEFHKMLLNGELPSTIGGGIGQSRICMFFLQKAHIGEVQASVWPKSTLEECRKRKIQLL